jgi:hypothetical protein
MMRKRAAYSSREANRIGLCRLLPLGSPFDSSWRELLRQYNNQLRGSPDQVRANSIQIWDHPKEWISRPWLIKREYVTQYEISSLLLKYLHSTPRAAIHEQMHTILPSGSSPLNTFDTLPDIPNVDLVDTFNNSSFDPFTHGVFEEVHGLNGWADQPNMSESVNQVIA